MKTGSEGRPWIQLEPKPPKVETVEQYWLEAPPQMSERCAYWVRQIHRGWLPNKYISREGYYTSAEWYGVWIWEYLNVLSPRIEWYRSTL